MRPHTDPVEIDRSRRLVGSGARFGRHCPGPHYLDGLCRLVLTRRGRLERLLRMRAPKIIVRNERRMLRAAVAALFAYGDPI